MGRGIDEKVLYSDDDLTVIATMHLDDRPGEDLLPDFPDDELEDMRERLYRGDFTYVGVVVDVSYQGESVGEDALWGIEHGTVADGVESDAFEWDYPISEMTDTALIEARAVATSQRSPEARIDMRTALSRAERALFGSVAA